ncbi:hypothetical protein [Cryobacterium sp. TMS1-13-1]|nr:hypothetical protein [Cryobacterium sp. TMS1-13-1]
MRVTGDALLSTLHNYLEAAGAIHPHLVVTVGDKDIERGLSALTGR